MRRFFALIVVPLALVALLGARPARAQTDITVPAGDVAALVAAVNAANADTTGPRTIRLTRSTYTFVAAHGFHPNEGGFALPLISRALTVEGNGATFVRVSAEHFRFLFVEAPLTLRDLTLRDGQVTSILGGGAVRVDLSGGCVFERCTFSGNNGDGYGGALFLEGPGNSVSHCTFVGNTAGRGGAIYTTNSIVVTNSTVVRNQATESGGGGGGGIRSTAGTVTLTSTILALNTSATASYQNGRGTFAATSSFVDDTSGMTVTDNGGNVLDSGDPLLGPLEDNGGLVPTCALRSGSAAIDAGANPGALTTDQRGAGFPRVNGAALDMGAYEHSAAPIVARVTASDVQATGTTYQFTVRYVSDRSGGGVDVTTLDGADVTVTGPSAFSRAASLVSVDVMTDGSPRVATYEITAPPGGWAGSHNGTYTINLLAGAVLDTGATAVADGAIDTFEVAVPGATGTAPDVTAAGATTHTITVTYTDDVAIDVSTLDDDDLVVNPGALAATFVNVDVNTDGTPRVATYTITPPGGTWDAADNGTYTLALQAGEVTDTSANAAAAGSVGSFTVAIDATAPGATGTAPDVTTAGGTTHTITVTCSDDVAIDVSTLDDDDLVVNPGALAATFVSVDVNTDGTPRVATYTITPPGGAWDAADNGTYTLALQAGEVTDTSANAAAAGSVGTFTVAIDGAAPAATGTAPDVTAAGATTHTITVTYTDDVAIDVSTLDDDDLVVNPGAGAATFVRVDVNTDGTPREATYRITPPGGTWNAADSGTYTIALRSGEVTDTSGKAVPAGDVGTFMVSVTDPFVPQNNANGGCSLVLDPAPSSTGSPLALALLALVVVRACVRRSVAARGHPRETL